MDAVRLARRAAGAAFRLVAAPFGRRALARAMAAGLPAQLEAPLASLFGTSPPERAQAVARGIEATRAEIARRPERYRFEHAADTAGVRWLVEDPSGEKTSRQLADAVSVQARWGMFLHLCAEAVQPRTILEVGTCVGISGAYLASASSKPELVTLDGSADLAVLSRRSLARVTDRATVVVGRFDETLQEAVAPLSLQLAYVDGHHDGVATREYVRTIIPALSAGALVVLDDIRLFRQMWEAWGDIAGWPGFTAAVDTGRFGLLVWQGGDVRAAEFDLSRYTGRWPVGPVRTTGPTHTAQDGPGVRATA